MNVIVPQYVVSTNSTTAIKNTSAVLLYSNIDAEPTSTAWSATAEYTTGNTCHYLETTGELKGVWCEYIALQDMTTALSTKNKVPPSEPLFWLFNGAINRYKMFDKYTSTATTSTTGNIEITLYCKSVSSIAFFNTQASAVTINAWNATSIAACNDSNKVIDDETISLEQTILDWYEYFFKPFSNTRDYVQPIDLNLYNNLIVNVEFTKYTGLDCYVGNFIVGSLYNLGKIRNGISTGIEDYSKKLFDDTFGSHYIQEGNYRKRLDCDLGIKNENINVVNSVLTQLRAKPTIWQANPTGYEFDNLIIYGIPRSFDILMEDINYTECSLEIDGLI